MHCVLQTMVLFSGGLFTQKLQRCGYKVDNVTMSSFQEMLLREMGQGPSPGEPLSFKPSLLESKILELRERPHVCLHQGI